MRKKTAIPAAALAALFALGLSAPAEARKAHRAKGTQLSHPSAPLPSKARARRAGSPHAAARRKSPPIDSAYQRVSFVSSEPAAAGRKKKKTFIRQNGTGR